MILVIMHGVWLGLGIAETKCGNLTKWAGGDKGSRLVKKSLWKMRFVFLAPLFHLNNAIKRALWGVADINQCVSSY